jgi:hypothetical protein
MEEGTLMEVDQKHITTVRLNDGKGCDVCVTKEGQDYCLRMVSSQHVVNIMLNYGDIRKLCQQLVNLDVQENWKAQMITPPEYRSFFFNGTPRYVGENMSNWFANMVHDAHEKASSRCATTAPCNS